MDLDALLAQEIEELNRDSEEDRRVKEAVIVAKRDPNKIIGDEDDSSDDEYYEDDLELRDPELYRTTESNRQIPFEEEQTPGRKKSIQGYSRPPELVFSEPPMTVTEPDRIVVSFTYGLAAHKPVKKSRKYFMACDFGEESLYAMSWAMGTMLRDGDEVHVATVVSTEDDVDDMADDEKYRLWQELDRKSKSLISQVRTKLGEMLLFNIKIVIYSIAGQTKEALLDLICNTPLTMVVCGSREKGAFKGLLMGSVSTFLVHNAPIPVSVVRPQKKTKISKKKLTAAQKLSQSVRSGQLRVDEVAGATPSAPNVHRSNSVDSYPN
ncbi:hypothetical protein BX666DRAFT_1852339 [Dichotomocladium elegans]|nr:hypothetical protein BX666DRAFT_1852339 [Dichotomocladium elegans]